MLAPDLGRMALTPKQVPEHNRALYQRKADETKQLAPYIHPRLSAVEAKTEQTQPFVITVSPAEPDPERAGSEVVSQRQQPIVN